MCRMLVAVGTLPMQQLVDGLRLMASGDNERYSWHENGQVMRHHHGWGAALNDDAGWSHIRMDGPPDGRMDELLIRRPDILLLHARRATVGAIIPENIHPFKADGRYFCHNGTVLVDIPASTKRSPVGTTDSERLFHALLDALDENEGPEAFERTLAKMRGEWSANSFMVSDDSIYVLSSFIAEPYAFPLRMEDGATLDALMEPKYYRLHIARTADFVVVSSERFPIEGTDWQAVSNHRVLTIDPDTLEVQEHPLA